MSLAALQDLLGWTFARPELLTEALTHTTYANENPGSGPHNERLEFVGDAVLDLLVAELLFATFPEAAEGELSRRRARVVRTSALAQLAQELRLSQHVRLGHGQFSAGAQSPRLLAGAVEAVAGAVFLDGGFVAVQQCFAERFARAIAQAGAPLDFKTMLQESCHSLALVAPRYEVLEVRGPDHARTYHCCVWLGERRAGEGVAGSKKEAEQLCARQALAELGVEDV